MTMTHLVNSASPVTRASMTLRPKETSLRSRRARGLSPSSQASSRPPTSPRPKLEASPRAHRARAPPRHRRLAAPEHQPPPTVLGSRRVTETHRHRPPC
uniref:Uncharacterized protein n=1 Tax=Arundo donax TaxID=35708 RepID=A0A0A8YMY6_ARUDO